MLTPSQACLIAMVHASNAVQDARDAAIAAGYTDAAKLFDHAGSQIFVGMTRVVKAEAERRSKEST